ncbi:MAG: preprotein translocase subunit SecE [Gemmataceae bacterium]|nr:preprotein translocase subunit SecE [Gemmataceae bacterium]MDW8264461.1 preprotein translocase subunit SecE [Gemmataceae bacterium]
MAVAVKNSAESTANRPLARLAVVSLAGSVYVVAGLALIGYGIPSLWGTGEGNWLLPGLGGFVNTALLALFLIAAAVGLVAAGRYLLPAPPRGFSGGLFVGLAGLALIGWLTSWLGSVVEYFTYHYDLFGSAGPRVGIVVTILIGLGLLALGVRYYLSPAAEALFITLENQGWFTVTPYKKSQGQRVRRGTILGILVLTLPGIWILHSNNTLRTTPSWGLTIPFSGQVTVAERDRGDTDLAPGTVIDRFALRDVNAALANQYDVVYAGPPRLGLKVGQRLSAEQLEEIRQNSGEGRRPIVISRSGDSYEIKEPGDASFAAQNRSMPRKEFERELTRLRIDDKDPVVVRTLRPATGTVEYRQLTLIPYVWLTVPLLLVVLTVWLAYRIVNYPVFADFLIATEAELNKVSWTPRKRLFQDTIVVLVTVLLLTFFLATVDVGWGWILSNPYIGVLRVTRYSLTAESFRNLADPEKGNMPREVLVKLTPLERARYESAGDFLAAVERLLGRDEAARYRQVLLEYADVRNASSDADAKPQW